MTSYVNLRSFAGTGSAIRTTDGGFGIANSSGFTKFDANGNTQYTIAGNFVSGTALIGGGVALVTSTKQVETISAFGAVLSITGYNQANTPLPLVNPPGPPTTTSILEGPTIGAATLYATTNGGFVAQFSESYYVRYTSPGSLVQTNVSYDRAINFNASGGTTSGEYAFTGVSGAYNGPTFGITTGETYAVTGGQLTLSAGGIQQGSAIANILQAHTLGNNNILALTSSGWQVLGVSQTNSAPVLFEPASETFNINETNQAVSLFVEFISATDSLNFPNLTYSLGGADAAAFTYSGGFLQLKSGYHDFENPLDSDRNNSYQVVVSATDSEGLSSSKSVTVNIADINETPTFSASNPATVSVFENGTAVRTISANTFYLPTTYTIVGGADAAAFTIIGSGDTSNLSFRSAPNFEAPTDSDGNNIYEVTVQVATAAGSAVYGLSVNVLDLVDTGLTINGTSGDDNLLGGLFNDTIYGLAGNDTLDGNLGTDRLYGGTGDDIYIFNTSADNAYELAGEGTDTIKTTSTSVTLDAHVENGMAIGTQTATQTVTLTGNDLNNVLTGNAAKNVIDGKAGADRMIGGAGNDTHTVDNVGDVVVENSGEGTDIVKSANLSLSLSANVENGTLTGKLGLNITGNDLDNVLTGNTANNVLSGGLGNDVLAGGRGQDSLYGGGGADRFNFGINLVQDGLTATDTIFDFSHAEGDKIVLSGVDANSGLAGNQNFAFLGTAAFSAIAGQLRYEQSAGNTVVSGDLDGDSVADFNIILSGINNLVAADFVL